MYLFSALCRVKIPSFNTMLFYWKHPFSSHLLHIFTLSSSVFGVRSATEPASYKLFLKKLILAETTPQSIPGSIKRYFEEIHLIEIIFAQVKIYCPNLSNWHCPVRLFKANTNCKMELLTDKGVNCPHRACSLIMNVNGSFPLHLWLPTPNPLSNIQAFWFNF